ncbi:MAG: hypothetical protein Q9213_001020, partial [Squamulea squamosa]
MPFRPKPLDKDEGERKSATKPKHESTSEPQKPLNPFGVRIVRRFKDACEEYIERIEDMEHGRRDKRGKMTQKGLDHYYNLERRQKKRDARRREEKERKRGKDGEGGEVVEAMMSGGRGGPSRHGGDIRRGGHGDGEDGHRNMNNGDAIANPPAMEAPIREMLPQPEAQGYAGLGRGSALSMQVRG